MVAADDPRHLHADHLQAFAVNSGQLLERAVSQSQLEILRDKRQFGIIAVRLFALVEKVHPRITTAVVYPRT